MGHTKADGSFGHGLDKYENDRWIHPKEANKGNLRKILKNSSNIDKDLIEKWINKVQNIENFTVFNPQSLAAAILFLYYADNVLTTETFNDEIIKKVIVVYDDYSTKRQFVFLKADILRYLINLTQNNFKTEKINY